MFIKIIPNTNACLNYLLLLLFSKFTCENSLGCEHLLNRLNYTFINFIYGRNYIEFVKYFFPHRSSLKRFIILVSVNRRLILHASDNVRVSWCVCWKLDYDYNNLPKWWECVFCFLFSSIFFPCRQFPLIFFFDKIFPSSNPLS